MAVTCLSVVRLSPQQSASTRWLGVRMKHMLVTDYLACADTAPLFLFFAKQGLFQHSALLLFCCPSYSFALVHIRYASRSTATGRRTCLSSCSCFHALLPALAFLDWPVTLGYRLNRHCWGRSGSAQCSSLWICSSYVRSRPTGVSETACKLAVVLQCCLSSTLSPVLQVITFSLIDSCINPSMEATPG